MAACIALKLGLRLRAQADGPTQTGRGYWLRLGLFIGGVLLLALVTGSVYLCYLRAYGLVHPGRAPVQRLPESVGISSYQEVTIPSTNGVTLRGWYAPARNGAAVIFIHGQGANRTALLAEAALMNRLGYGTLLFDLRNQGESNGEITTLGLRESEDVIAAVRFVQAQDEIDPTRVALVGQSMGGASALIAIPKLPEVRGLVVECSFTSLEDNIATGVKDMGLPVYPFAPLVVFFGQREAGIDISQVRPIDSLAAYDRPLLIIHGGRDDMIPVKNAYALYAAAREPKSLYIISEASHCDFDYTAGAAYEKQLTDFLQSALDKAH